MCVCACVCLCGWFTEMNDMWPGQAMSLQVDEILHHEKLQYLHLQMVCVRESFPVTYHGIG